jgi:hypothetical protein
VEVLREKHPEYANLKIYLDVLVEVLREKHPENACLKIYLDVFMEVLKEKHPEHVFFRFVWMFLRRFWLFKNVW